MLPKHKDDDVVIWKVYLINPLTEKLSMPHLWVTCHEDEAEILLVQLWTRESAVACVSGPMARTIGDLALMLDAMTGQDPRFPSPPTCNMDHGLGQSWKEKGTPLP